MAAPLDARRKRGPGRPPDLEKRQAIVDATLELLAEVGYGSLTIDAVAQRAGSNRVLVYRVWDSKVALVADVLFGRAAGLVVPDTGTVVDDLRDYVGQLVDRMSDPAYVKGVPGLTVELQANHDLFRDTYRRYIEPSVAGFRTIFERAVARGEVAEAPDARVVTYAVSGVTTSLAQNTRLTRDEVVDVLVRMLSEGLLNN